jgi:hypothetical protein
MSLDAVENLRDMQRRAGLLEYKENVETPVARRFRLSSDYLALRLLVNLHL